MNADAATLSWPQSLAVMPVLASFLLSADVVVIASRGWTPKNRRTGDSVMRSWLAVSLVGALVLSVAPTLFLSDGTLRSTINGGIVASASSAVAFYFLPKSAGQARQDILGAAFAVEVVPDLAKKTRGRPERHWAPRR